MTEAEAGKKKWIEESVLMTEEEKEIKSSKNKERKKERHFEKNV